ncbi:MAG: response regulator [Bacteroidales bacterium]|nr:response regulator [Bacteroidales bacterium]
MKIYHKKDRKEYINHIKLSGEVLLNLINDIIDLAKIEAGEIKVNKSSTSINEIINELQFYYKEAINQSNKNIELKIVRPTQEDFKIKTDPFRVKQILSNLIGNALKFTYKGYVEFGYELQGEHVIRFYVKDTGIGIPNDQLDIIFERFRQIENTSMRNFGGTGLGLSITKNLVELLGGKIWLESTLNKGTTFYFTLPFNKLKKADGPIAKELEYKENYNWQHRTILIAEDDNASFEVLKLQLKNSKATVVRATTGKQAVEMIANNHKIDLVLMDIQMPELDGYEATRQIKTHSPHLPVIAQTAYAMSGEKEKSKKAGCDDYISKPVNIKLLFAKINALLKLIRYASFTVKQFNQPR